MGGVSKITGKTDLVLKCANCGSDFRPHQSNPNKKLTKCCSPKCSAQNNQRNQRDKIRQINLGRKLGLSGGKIGRINQILVCIDLIKKGWDVYEAFEETHPFDVLAINGPRIVKIEVKTANKLPGGSVIISNGKDIDYNKFDVLATVLNLSEISYSQNMDLGSE